MSAALRVLLWSYTTPEPTGIGPVSTVLAPGPVTRGDEVDVVASPSPLPLARVG